MYVILSRRFNTSDQATIVNRNATKLKPMKPSLRERKRYLTFEIISETPVQDEGAISDELYETLSTYLGDEGMADAGVMFLADTWNQRLQRAIIKVNNKHMEKLKTGLALIESIGQNRVIVRSYKVSGTLKTAREHCIAS